MELVRGISRSTAGARVRVLVYVCLLLDRGLGKHVEEHFNESFFVDYFCDGCESQSLAEKRLFLKASLETNFLVILLRRSVLGDDGNFIVTNMVKSVDDIKIM